MEFTPPSGRPKRIWPTFEEAVDFLEERVPNWKCSACGHDDIILDVGNEKFGYPQTALMDFNAYGLAGRDVMRGSCLNCGLIHDFNLEPLRTWLAAKGKQPE